MLRFFVYVPGMTVDANVMQNRSLGGSESAGAYLCRALVWRGHQVTMFANVPGVMPWAAR